MMTIEEAVSAHEFFHVRNKDSRGNPVKVRRNGRTLVWKTRPGQFRIPVKYGLYEYGYITQDNAIEWEVK